MHSDHIYSTRNSITIPIHSVIHSSLRSHPCSILRLQIDLNCETQTKSYTDIYHRNLESCSMPLLSSIITVLVPCFMNHIVVELEVLITL